MARPHPEHLRRQAQAMYIPGVVGAKRISQQLGVSHSTIYRWLNPDYAARSRENARRLKQTYRGSCKDCGAPTAYNGKPGQRSSLRCRLCAHKQLSANRKWNRDSVVAAIHRWHQEHGRRPTPKDWIRAGPYHPAVSGIYQGSNPIFDSWSDALRAAGYTEIKFSPGPGKQMFDRQEARKLRQHMTDKQIAQHYGVTDRAIHQALGPRNKPKPQHRTAAQRRQARIDALNRALAHHTPSD